jgi:hypothetical protein
VDLTKDPIQFWTAVGAFGAVLAAVGTIAAFAIAFYQIFSERRARRKDDRTAQARRISGWIDGTLPDPSDAAAPLASPATLLNASDEPVYRVIAWLVLVQGAGPQTGEEMQQMAPFSPAMLAILPPGRYVVRLPGDWGGMFRRPGVEVAFTDAAGRHWIRRATGRLEEIPNDPVEHYGVDRPVSWDLPTPDLEHPPRDPPGQIGTGSALSAP